MKLNALFNHENALPTSPQIIQELIESFRSENISIDELAGKIALNPVLSANVLRLANSPYYRVSRQIGSIKDAIAMLGFVTVRTLVITCSLVSRFKTTPGINLKQFWRYSLSTAVAGKWLAGKTGEESEMAFTAGVVHGLGQLMLHLGLPEQSTTLDKIVSIYSENRLQMEQDVFGFNHADVSAELVARWKFPDPLVAAIRAYSRPFEANDLNRQAAILYLASWLARMDELACDRAARQAALPTHVVELLALTPAVLLDEIPTLSELRAGLEDLMP
ncbi:MAG: HDOD domain-containing protein [Sterolibacterium sp.]|nr:HDOD domain-containing protein [Sterolibacterium sp.]